MQGSSLPHGWSRPSNECREVLKEVLLSYAWSGHRRGGYTLKGRIYLYEAGCEEEESLELRWSSLLRYRTRTPRIHALFSLSGSLRGQEVVVFLFASLLEPQIEVEIYRPQGEWQLRREIAESRQPLSVEHIPTTLRWMNLISTWKVFSWRKSHH